MKRFLVIATVVTVLICALLLSTGVAYAATSTPFVDALTYLFKGFGKFADTVVELFEIAIG